MSRIRQTFASMPGARAVWRVAKSLPGQLCGLPAIDYSNISGRTLRSCVDRDDPTILEVGCNDGQTTAWFLELFENPRIYCFEPDPRAVVRFKERVATRPEVTLFEVAISDRVGTIAFYQSGGRRDDKWLVKTMPEGWDLSGSIKQPSGHLKKHPLVTFDKTLEVPTTTLDALCEEYVIDCVDLIWMDVHGAELDVLRSAAKTLERTRYLYTEYSDKELYKGQGSLRRIATYLSDFDVVARHPGDILLRNLRFATERTCQRA